MASFKKLGIRIGLTTILDILKRAGHHPVPDKGGGHPPSHWKQFISSHMDTLIACDFFTKPILTWKGRIDATVLVFNERPHQGVDIGNKVLRPDFTPRGKGEIKRAQRLGGIISWYYREAA